MNKLPVLYSFRRCPYAMRARMALQASATKVRLREVVLRDKPAEMIAASEKATVPVLVLDGGHVIDESLVIMQWALGRNDPLGWMQHSAAADPLIAKCDDEFKYHLDRYKYPNRYNDIDPLVHRAAGLDFLLTLDGLIAQNDQIVAKSAGIADYAIFPFVRQFANTDRNWFDAQKLPALQNWLQGHLSSDLFAATMTKYPQWKTGDAESHFPDNCGVKLEQP